MTRRPVSQIKSTRNFHGKSPFNKMFQKNRKQTVVRNGRFVVIILDNAFAGVPQGSILHPLFFLIYVNEISDDLFSNSKLFSDDTSLFSVVHDKSISANELKGALSGLRHFLKIESSLTVMKNAFYFTSKALFVLKIFKFLS